jgi:Cu(I)/Ag(I) efflux system membrane protein CusA/SilA
MYCGPIVHGGAQLIRSYNRREALALRERRALTRDDLYAATMEGAVERVRPKIMTVVAITAGLLPILWSHGAGSEVMQRIGVPMIGGMASSTLLTLVVIPAIYAMAKTWKLPSAAPEMPVRMLAVQS